ncbi:polysaccharide pyruvyl transferase family protein [Eggerthella sinensis]|uniref:polysaccharide pyruvyl transferase family protein n=1 Tax=Eggerthella sinensis TaxID=242230 RepID=UPI00266D5CD5|nr:polysaccharide pyruvyl transferase family protein [Eggerthella sinensis]
MQNDKIGILTSTPSFFDNYGAVLQGFALQSHVKGLNYEPLTLSYRGLSEQVRRKKANPMERFAGIFLSGNSLSQSIGTIVSKRGREARKAIFKEFVDEHISLADELVNYEELLRLVSEFDAFICGSDQVWNPRVHGGKNDPGYFLQFAVGKVRTIAYAPSFGVSTLPEVCMENLAEYVGGIDFVSVREDSGAKLLAEYAGVEAPVVVDPTLLLTAADWDSIAMKPEWLPARYLAVYKFGERSEYDKLIRETARKLGLDIVNIPAAVDPVFKTRWDIGPSEFLAIIRGAELVCTDSFHATVFSVTYRRPCIVFPRDAPGSAKSMNSRMEGFLRRLGLKARYAAMPSEWDSTLSAGFDLEDAHERLDAWRTSSKDFLNRALEGVGE